MGVIIDHVFAPGWWLDAPRRTSGVSRRSARSRATPWMRADFIMNERSCIDLHNKPTFEKCSKICYLGRCNQTMQLIRYHQVQSTPPSPESTSLCTRDDVTVVDECQQSTTKQSTHAKTNFQMNIFHDGLKTWIDWSHHSVCPGSYPRYAFQIYKANIKIETGISRGDRDAI